MQIGSHRLEQRYAYGIDASEFHPTTLATRKGLKTNILFAEWLTAFQHALGLHRACEAQQVSQESSRFRTTHQHTLAGQQLRMPSCRKEIGGNGGENVLSIQAIEGI